ncbi:hypothetical protein NHF46_11735 [Arthrobacter alpinus]|nr:hypothetical protein [Arthrobacter alpinus]
MDEQQFSERKAGGGPETYREIMFHALSPQLYPTRAKLTDDVDLSRLSLSPNQLVEMLAKALAENVAKALAENVAKALAEKDNREFRPEDAIGIDTELKGPAVAKILDNKTTLPKLIRSELGPLRQEQIEEDAREILRVTTTPNHPYTPDEAAAAVGKITWKDRNDLAGSFTRTISECTDVLVTLVRAYLDRSYGTKEQARETMSEDEARLRGPATSEMFYRAVEPITEDAVRALVIGPALVALPALDNKLRAPHTLAKQLAPKRYLLLGQDKQLAAETVARSHFPFGLQRPGSLAILAAAIYLTRAECSSTIIRESQPLQNRAQGPAVLFIPTLNTLNAAVKDKSKMTHAAAGTLNTARLRVPWIACEQPHPAFP